MKTPPRTILFDLDGTLVDSIDLIIDSYTHTFRTHGLRVPDREEIIAGIGTPLRTVFGAISSDPVEVAAWTATYREYNLANHDARVMPIAPAVQLALRAASSGRVLGLVTSKNNAGARRGLAHVGLADAIPVVIGADDVINPKPDPEPVLRALEMVSSTASDACFIGDSPYDIISGKAAGVTAIGVTWGPFPRQKLLDCNADHCCDTAAELVAVLGLD